MSRRMKVSNTERAYDDLMDEFSNLVEAMEDVFSAAAEDGGEKLSELKGQAEASLKKAKARLGVLEKNTMAKARKIASDSDDYVHENPWTAIGVGAGVGLLLGLLSGRGRWACAPTSAAPCPCTRPPVSSNPGGGSSPFSSPWCGPGSACLPSS